MDLNALVGLDGTRVVASGRVVAGTGPDRPAGRCRFEPPMPSAPAPTGTAPAGAQPVSVRPAHALSVAAHGVREAGLAWVGEGPRREAYAELSGTWHPRAQDAGAQDAGALHVHAQRPAEPADPDPPPDLPRHPPCAPPPGGWPPTAAGLPAMPDPAALAEHGVAGVALFRPEPDRPVLVVAASDPAEVAGWLRPRWGGRLCVVASRWPPGAAEHVRAALAAAPQSWRVLSVAATVGADGQPLVDAEVVLVEADLASWAAGVPDGLLRLRPWLAPAGTGPA